MYWKTLEEMEKWFEEKWTFDEKVLEEFAKYLKYSLKKLNVEYRIPQDSFLGKIGGCADSTLLSYEGLKQLEDVSNPILWTMFLKSTIKDFRTVHHCCSFERNKNIYIFDFGHPPKYKILNGTHGPFKTYFDYNNIYEKTKPTWKIEKWEKGMCGTLCVETGLKKLKEKGYEIV